MNVALVLGSGNSSRFGHVMPKQYFPLGDGYNVFGKSLIAFAGNPSIDKVLPVISPGHDVFFEETLSLLPKNLQTKIAQPCYGGNTRSSSAKNGIMGAMKLWPKNILIHDAARPFVSQNLINAVLLALQNGSLGAVPVMEVTESLCEIRDDRYIERYLKRPYVRTIQTPQGFCAKTLEKCYANLDDFESFTDDAGVLLHNGYPVTHILGEKSNIKITFFEDLELKK